MQVQCALQEEKTLLQLVDSSNLRRKDSVDQKKKFLWKLEFKPNFYLSVTPLMILIISQLLLSQ